MTAVRTLLFVLLSVGVAAPVAASPAVAAAAWPGVSDVLLNVAGPAPEAAWPGVPVVAWPGLKHSHFVGMGTPSKTAAWECTNFNLQRLVAEFAYFENDGEAFTNKAVPGDPIYQKTVDVPDGCDTLYISFSGTGDEDVGEWFSCNVDSVFCNPGCNFGTGLPCTPGWISLQHVPGELTDNGISYTWCVQTTPGTHAVEIRMASQEDGAFSFFETAHFYIDASFTGGGCVKAAPVEEP